MATCCPTSSTRMWPAVPVWGNTGGTGKQVVGTGVRATTTVYGRVAQADAAVALGGSYTDTVTVTIVF